MFKFIVNCMPFAAYLKGVFIALKYIKQGAPGLGENIFFFYTRYKRRYFALK